MKALLLTVALVMASPMAMAATVPVPPAGKTVTPPPGAKQVPKLLLYDRNRMQVRTAPKELPGPQIR
jgi:hypothetical protein